MHLRVLIPVTILLIIGAFLGVMQAAAKDDVTTFEGVIFWLSLPALPVLLLALLGLVCVGIWRGARS
jgi:hypothetical protein